jgi:hypothetical protein
MLESFKNRVRMIRDSLTRLDDHPIGKAALTVVLFLDLFILVSIFQGLADHTRQLAKPGDIVPQHCREIVIDENWNENNRLLRIAKIVSNSRGRYFYAVDRYPAEEEHPICMSISVLIRSIEGDKTIADNLSDYLRLRAQITQVKSELGRVSGAYDTSLLGVIAEQSSGADSASRESPNMEGSNKGRPNSGTSNAGTANSGSTASLKIQVSELTNNLNSLVHNESALKLALEQNKHINTLFEVIRSSSETDREKLLAELRNLNFWYPVKRLGMEMLFLLPLAFIFYLWNSKSISANRPYQSLVSSHLLAIVFIPLLFKLMELVYDIVPKKLLAHILDFLEAFKLVAIWHYSMMIVGILAALGLIYFLQKKIFSHEKIVQKRITKGLCQNCGVRLPAHSPVCPACGFNQYKACEHCGKPTYVFGNYCKECGHGE